jgi:phospholipid/cholesterol/gamma-HCH transport system substrate-binding protein
MKSLHATAVNAEVITYQLAEIMANINSGEGTIGRLIQDTTIAENINKTILNLRRSSRGLDENMEAVKHNFLLKGFFKKKERAAEKKKEDAEEQKVLDENNKK